jgi:hypothetical protein
MLQAPYQVHARTDPFHGERPPRGYSRTEQVDLNLFDAGHGDQVQARNPVLLGMGVTVRLRLNTYVRKWRVFLSDGATEIEVTHAFKRVASRMYELRGVAGAGLLNPAGRSDWSAATRLVWRVETSNVTLESTFRANFWVQDDEDSRSCGEPCLDDLPLLQMLRKYHIRLWRDGIEPTRQPRDTDQTDLIYLFEQAEQLVGLDGDICACLNYHTQVMIGIRFFVVGSCDEASLAPPTFGAGCNPWDEETLPEQDGQAIMLPSGWETSGC